MCEKFDKVEEILKSLDEIICGVENAEECPEHQDEKEIKEPETNENV